MNLRLLKQFLVTFSEDETVHLMSLISPPAYSRPTVERDGCHPMVHLWLHLKHCCFRLHPCKWMQCRSWGEKAVWAEDMAPHGRASPVSLEHGVWLSSSYRTFQETKNLLFMLCLLPPGSLLLVLGANPPAYDRCDHWMWLSDICLGCCSHALAPGWRQI